MPLKCDDHIQEGKVLHPHHEVLEAQDPVVQGVGHPEIDLANKGYPLVSFSPLISFFTSSPSEMKFSRHILIYKKKKKKKNKNFGLPNLRLELRQNPPTGRWDSRGNPARESFHPDWEMSHRKPPCLSEHDTPSQREHSAWLQQK